MSKKSFFFLAGAAFFFFSGFAGLVYEVIWFKRFAVVWGSSTPAMACVVASFLAGLGIGAHLAGNRADRIPMPFLYYGMLEIATGLFALLIPLEIIFLQKLASLIYPTISGYQLVHSLVRLSLTFLAIGPVCIMMGATLPLLVSQFSRLSNLNSVPVAWLYAANTLGAAAGCFTAGFYLLPAIGLSGSNFVAASLNVAIGLVSLVFSMRMRSLASAFTGSSNSEVKVDLALSHGSAVPLHVVSFVVFFTGCAALMLQVVWTRQLTVMLGGSTYAFSAMLFVFLLGIGLGSLLYQFGIVLIERQLTVTLGICVLLLTATVALGKTFIPELSAIVGLLKPIRHQQMGNAAVCVLFSAIIEFVPVVLLGILFPLCVKLFRATTQAPGKATGTVYAFNTWGSILGAAFTGLFLIPQFGTVGILTVALCLFTVALGLVAVSVSRAQRQVLTAIILMCLVAVVSASGKFDPRDTDKGKFMYGYSAAHSYADKAVYFKEGRNCNVLVSDLDGHRSLRVNGKVDASNQGDMKMQLGLAYLPRLLRPKASDILVIGFGSGTSSGASLLFPNTRVDCCEIEPAVYHAAEHFSDVNHSPQDSPNFHIIFDDARAYVQGTRKNYDLILSEPSNPWLAGVSSLFTVEFYQQAKTRLRTGGILAQWIQTYSIPVEAYRAIMQTASSVFPNCALVRISDGDTVLLASPSSLIPTQEDVQVAQQLIANCPAVRRDLEAYFETTNVVDLFLRHVLLSNAELRRLCDETGKAFVTDYNLRLEFETPSYLFAHDRSEQNKINVMLAQAMDVSWIESLLRLSSEPKAHLNSLKELSSFLKKCEATNDAASVVALGLRYDPFHAGLVVNKCSSVQPWDKKDLTLTVLKLMEREVSDANRLGVELWQHSQYRSAVSVFETILSKQSNCATAWVNLGVNREALGETKSAEEAFTRALALDPLNSFAKESHEKFMRKTEHLRSKTY